MCGTTSSYAVSHKVTKYFEQITKYLNARNQTRDFEFCYVISYFVEQIYASNDWAITRTLIKIFEVSNQVEHLYT